MNALNRLWRASSPVRALLVAAALTVITPVVHAKEPVMTKPTVVLVHGAFAESASWNRVTTKLLAKGYPVVAVANPLRSVKGDASYLASLLDAIPGPVILVGHSYGGTVITVAATGRKHAGADARAPGCADRRQQRLIHSAGEISRPVCRRLACERSQIDGRQPAAHP